MEHNCSLLHLFCAWFRWFIRAWMKDTQNQGAGSVWGGRVGHPLLFSFAITDPSPQLYTPSPGQLSQLTNLEYWAGEETAEFKIYHLCMCSPWLSHPLTLSSFLKVLQCGHKQYLPMYAYILLGPFRTKYITGKLKHSTVAQRQHFYSILKLT